MPYCKNCGQEIEANAKFCSNCGLQFSAQPAAAETPAYAPPSAQPMRWTKPFPLIGGILTVIASCLLIVAAILCFALWFNIYYLITGIFGIIAFSFSLTASIMTLKRKNIYLSITGLSLLVAAGAMTIVAYLPLGIPIMVLAIVGLVFVALAKSEFH